MSPSNPVIDILVPSESFEGTRARLLRWMKAVGEPVAMGEPLVEVETDKVTVEIAAPGAGVLAEFLKVADDELEVGDLLGRIRSDGVAVAAAVTAPASAAPALAARGAASGTSAEPSASGALSPAVRRLLSEHRLTAADVVGTSAGGRINVDDVLKHVAERGTPAATAPAPRAAEQSGPVERVPHSATRRRTAERMVDSLLKSAPHVTTVFEADLGAVLAHREATRAALLADGVPLTLTAYFVAACVSAIRAVPEANARWTDEATELFAQIDIGIATAVEDRGLVVPVIRDVAALGLREIAARLNDLATRARGHSLQPADVRGGTFTISNHGVSGSLLATPIIINQPQSAILGIGKLEKRAVVVERDGVDVVVVRPRCYVTLTLDHRVMDGHQANRFLSAWVAAIEGWGR
jgi:2-oxoglutarate dehydrogenase E2 component (dihydrolipoamide succinyltransferase)